MPDPIPPDTAVEKMRISRAFWLAVVGLFLAAALVVFLTLYGEKATEVVAIVGLFTSVLGTLIGAFFGLQVGSAGRDKAMHAADQANQVAMRAMAALPPDLARHVIDPSRQA